MAAIVRDLPGTRHPTLCPHGRPTIVRVAAGRRRALVRAHGLEAAVRVRTNARKKRPGGAGPWLLHTLGRTLQVTGLLITLVAATAFFGTPSTVAMLRMMLAGVLVFLPGGS